MTDRHAEGLEKAAEAVWESIQDKGIRGRLFRGDCLPRPRARRRGQLEGLDALPVGTVVRSGAGTIACHYGNGLGVVFGDEWPFSWDRIALPARVIHWGGTE